MPRSATDLLSPRRLAIVDALRGLALLAMVAYHACWDLVLFGLAAFALYDDPIWLSFRTAVASGFLFLVGVSLVLARRAGHSSIWLVRRFIVLAACAAGISLASLVFAPASPVHFGILHHIAMASLVGWVLVPVPRWVLVAGGVAAWSLPEVVSHSVFDTRWLDWIGLATRFPNSVDFVPLLPWGGAVLFGLAVGKSLDGLSVRWPGLAAWQPAQMPGRALVWLGRHSLVLYLVHQPVLMALIGATVILVGL